jgi:hypothetical protein
MPGVRLQEANDHRTRLDLANLLEGERRDGQDDIGLRQHGSLTTRPFALLVQRVRKLRADSRAGFEQHPGSRASEFVDDLRYERDASFTGRALFERAYRDRHLD